MKTILLIEDDAWLAELYSDVLRAAGYGVVHALEAQRGIELLDTQPIDAIVLDILLPEHNGIGLLHELRAYPDLAQIPVIIQSAIDPTQSDIDEDAWQAYGVVAYISKVTARPQELVRTVRRILDNEAI